MNQDTSKQSALLDTLLGVEARKWGNARKLPAAIRILQELEPAGGKEIPVYPASFAGARDDDPPCYDLNGITWGPSVTVRTKNGTKDVASIASAAHCVIDSYQSQANRMEPAFADTELATLVPQVKIKVPRRQGDDPAFTDTLSVLEIAHRVADFRVRLSDQHRQVKRWIGDFESGNALGLLKHLPTSLLFGFWDSRDQGTKHARILLSRIDAFNVVPCMKRSIYSGMYSKEEVLRVLNLPEDAKVDEKVLSERGFTNAPGSGLGGVLVQGKITRTSLLSLTDIARIRCGGDTTLTNAARRYLFCLGLLAEAYQAEMGDFHLRSGCELVVSGPPAYSLQGGQEVAGLLELCQNQQTLKQIALSAMQELKISAEPITWELSVESLKKEFDDAMKKKEDKKEKTAAKKAAAKTSKTSKTEPEPESGE